MTQFKGNATLAYHEGRNGFANSSHNAKGWLISIASQAGDRAVSYGNQLLACGK